MSNYFDEDENPLGEIIQQQEEKEQEELLQALEGKLSTIVDAINQTNKLIEKADGNTQKVNRAVGALNKALTSQDGQNIADYITKALETHQKALSRSGIDTLDKTMSQARDVIKQLKQSVEKLTTELPNQLGRIDDYTASRLKKQTDYYDQFDQRAVELIETLAKPRIAELKQNDTILLQQVPDKVQEVISKQKRWWIGLGAAMVLSLMVLIAGVSRNITAQTKLDRAEKKLDRAETIYKNHRYTWEFCQYMSDWGDRNPKTYKSIRDDFRTKLPELAEQYDKEFPEVAD